MSTTNNLSLRQVRLLCILGAGLPPFHDVQSTAERQQRQGTLHALAGKELIEIDPHTWEFQQVTAEGKALYAAIKEDFSALFSGTPSTAAALVRGRGDRPEMPAEASQTKHNTTLQLWMQSVCRGVDSDSVARHFDLLVRSYRSGGSVHYGRGELAAALRIDENLVRHGLLKL